MEDVNGGGRVGARSRGEGACEEGKEVGRREGEVEVGRG